MEEVNTRENKMLMKLGKSVDFTQMQDDLDKSIEEKVEKNEKYERKGSQVNSMIIPSREQSSENIIEKRLSPYAKAKSPQKKIFDLFDM